MRLWPSQAMTSRSAEDEGGPGGSERLRLLAELVQVLERFISGEYDLWQQLAGRRQLLHHGLRQAVRQAGRRDSDPVPLLDRCWALLSEDVVPLGVQEFYRRDPDYQELDVGHERVVGGARKLVATAQVAVAAVESSHHHFESAERLTTWALKASELFHGSKLDHTLSLEREAASTPAALVSLAYESIEGGAAGASFWTLEWMGAAPVGQVLKAPVAGYHPVHGGFCADLRLRCFEGDGELVEHPEMALRPLGSELVDVIRQAWEGARARPAPGGPPDGHPEKAPCRGPRLRPWLWLSSHASPSAGSLYWAVTVRERRLDPLVPLDGPSLSGPARVAFQLLSLGRRGELRSVVVAQAGPDEQLQPVGFEREKLEAASASGIRRAIVAPDAELSEADRDDFRRQRLDVRAAYDVPSAVKLLQPRRRVRLAAVMAVLLLAVGVAIWPATKDRRLPPEKAPNAMLYRWRNGDRCRLNIAPDQPFLRGWGQRDAEPIAEVEIKAETRAKRLLSYTRSLQGERDHTYVLETDSQKLDELIAGGWELTGGRRPDAGLAFREQEPGTIALWRGRKGSSHCVSTSPEEMQHRGYTELEVVAYVWPYAR